MNVRRSSCEVPVIFVTNEPEFSGQIFKKYSNFVRVCSVESELLHAKKKSILSEGQTDRHDETSSRFSLFYKRA